MGEKDKNPCHVVSYQDRFVKGPKPPSPFPEAHAGSHRPYKMIALIIGLPIIIANSVSLLLFSKEKERPPFVPYSFLRIRRKKFPWGDGNKSLFHNPRVNALPEGYEEMPDKEEEE